MATGDIGDVADSENLCVGAARATIGTIGNGITRYELESVNRIVTSGGLATVVGAIGSWCHLGTYGRGRGGDSVGF